MARGWSFQGGNRFEYAAHRAGRSNKPRGCGIRSLYLLGLRGG